MPPGSRATRGSPPSGQKLTREFKGRTVEVLVTADGFEYEDQTFKSISAVARRITGYMVSGPVFFKLDKPARTSDGLRRRPRGRAPDA